MPTTTTARKARPAKNPDGFRRIITPEEMIEEMEKICRNKRTEIAFFRKIGLDFSPASRTKKKTRVKAS